MAAVTTANPADFANRVQTYFNPKLLKAIDNELVFAQFGMQGKYPAKGTTIRFFRPRQANITGTTQGGTAGRLVEGTTATVLTEVAVGYVDVALYQRGALATITDLVQAVDLLDTVSLYTKTMGADAALDLDTIVRIALVTALNDSDATYGATHNFERMAGVTATASSSTDFGTFHALTAANAKFTRAVHLGCITQLKVSKIPKINGKYIAVTPAQVLHDIRQDTTLVSAFTNVDSSKLYKNAQVELDGAIFVESTNPHIEGSTYKTYDAAGVNFTTHYLGDGAFGIPMLSNGKAGGSPMEPHMTVLAGPDKSDPLNQKTCIGWKAFYGCGALITNLTGERPYYLSLRTKSTW